MPIERKAAIFGKVTDFENHPLQGASVEIKDDHFKTIYKALTDSKGEYKIFVQKGSYLALMAHKDYKTKYLEYWAWNPPAYRDLQIDPRIGGIEVYAMNAFKPQGAYPSLLIYFRPMSLKRSLNAPKKTDIMDISPNLSADDIDLKINGSPVQILELNRVQEYAGGIGSVIAYLVQSTLPRRSLIAYLIQAALHSKKLEAGKGVDHFRIDLSLIDRQTGERGAGCLFWKRQKRTIIA